MKKISIGTAVGVIILIIAIVAIIYWLRGTKQDTQTGGTDSSGATSTVKSSASKSNQSVSDGTIKFAYPSGEFGLAVNKAQIPVHSYIPPCDENFNYCVYYKGTAYQGTNFESAGVRIQKRADLADEKSCLNTPPPGYGQSTPPDSTKSSANYSSSVFANVSDAGAGHFAVGSLYRLFVKKAPSCYEIETRIGQTQFANYPQGAIKEFTTDDMKSLQSKLWQIIGQISLSSGDKNIFISYTDYRNATYLVEGQKVTLVNGRAETAAAPGSASQTVTQYFGNIAFGDLNGDGLPDAAFIITQNSGSSGTFYYVVAALKSANGYTGSNAILLGDRIAPQNNQIRNGEITVNYAIRRPTDPMTDQPSMGVSKYLKLQDTTLVEIH